MAEKDVFERKRREWREKGDPPCAHLAYAIKLRPASGYVTGGCLVCGAPLPDGPEASTQPPSPGGGR